MGRPTLYTQSTVREICRRLALGDTLRRMCAEDDLLPHRDTVNEWLIRYPDFADRVARARETGSHALIEENRDIADDSSNDYMERRLKDGTVVEAFNAEHVQRSKLRIEQRWREAEAILPQRYGKRQLVEHSGGVHVTLQDDDAMIAELLAMAETGRLRIPGIQLAEPVEDEDEEPALDGYEDIA